MAGSASADCNIDGHSDTLTRWRFFVTSALESLRDERCVLIIKLDGIAFEGRSAHLGSRSIRAKYVLSL